MSYFGVTGKSAEKSGHKIASADHACVMTTPDFLRRSKSLRARPAGGQVRADAVRSVPEGSVVMPRDCMNA
jgi:hypothetical protein